MGIPEDHTDLGRGETLLCEFKDLFLDLITGHLHPLGNSTPVGQSRLGYTLARSVHATHLSGFFF